MKKLIAKEFLWLVGILLLSFPLSILLRNVVGDYLKELNEFLCQFGMAEAGALMESELYLTGIVGLYIVRFVSGAISTLAAKDEDS